MSVTKYICLPKNGPPLGSIVWLKWTDHAQTPGWKLTNVEAHLLVCESIGFLHEWSEEKIVVAQSIANNEHTGAGRDRYQDMNSVSELQAVARALIIDWCMIKE